MPEVAAKDGTRPYKFHGVVLAAPNASGQANGDCPFCGKEGKFTVAAESGLAQCKVCQAGSGRGGMNPVSFLRLLWESSTEKNLTATEELRAGRKLLSKAGLSTWGLVISPLSGEWLVPGYNPAGELCQLYRYARFPGGKYRLLPTPGLAHQLHYAAPFDASKPVVYVTEGPWDGLALWETLRLAKEDGKRLTLTGAVASSLAATAEVVSVPGCGVFPESWCSLFAGKVVTLCYDNDYPREHPPGSGKFTLAGFEATKRTAGILARSPTPPAEIRYLSWGENGYDPSLPNGCDVRDFLGTEPTAKGRVARLRVLLERVTTVPTEWAAPNPLSPQKGKAAPALAPVGCKSWKELVQAWRKALKWRQEMEDVLAVMLAVALSTDQTGDQLFLQVIGDAGSGKSRFCDAMLTSKQCFSLEHMTGFHSGWQDGSGEDFSLLARINHRTLITPEGDVMMSSPRFQEIMSQQRRIFDGSSGATYKNRKDDQRYTGLRTPWIIAGTPALMASDQSRLGDRFLRVCLARPGLDETQEILQQVGFAALRAVNQTVNGAPETALDGPLAEAYAKTGGYIDRLRGEASTRLGGIDVDGPAVVALCASLGEFVADLRARPDPPKKNGQSSEVAATKELPTRLTHQFVRLSCCLAATMDEKTISKRVQSVVRKVAADTARGRTLDITKRLAGAGKDGLQAGGLALLLAAPDSEVRHLLRFLASIDCVETFTAPGKTVRPVPKWRLTPRLAALHKKVVR